MKPQHQTPEYRKARKDLTPVVAQGHAYCQQPVCKYPTRWIEPGTPWDVAHDEAGEEILGPAHAHCNRSEAATRGNRQRGGGATPPLPTRWSL